jgi:hypothetical protein
MLYMDLNANNTQLFQGQECPGQTLIRDDSYLGLSGALMFVDTLGMQDPSWDGLNDRHLLVYLSSGAPQVIPIQAAPVQNLSVVLDGQNCTIGIYDQLLATQPVTGAVAVIPDPGYINQSLLAPIASYVVAGYWDPSYSV